MDEKIVYTLGLKFKRLNIDFKYDDNVFTIGKTKKIVWGYVKGSLIALISLFFAIGIWPFTGFIFYLLYIPIFTFFAYGLLQILNSEKLTIDNKYKKIFTTDSIELVSKREVLKFKKKDIKDIVFEIKNSALLGQYSYGVIYILLVNGSKIQLLTLNEKKAGVSKVFKSDLDYITNQIKGHLNIY